MSMQEIERRAKALADCRERLSAIVGSLNADIDTLTRQAMPGMKRAVAAAADRHASLKELIEELPQLFVKPRTVTLHGIKLGYAKGKGSVEFDDADQVVKLIKKLHPDNVDVLIAVTEKPVKDALAQLTAGELKRLGVTVEGTSDVVVIKCADSAVDKTVKALLKAAVEDTEEMAS